MQIAEVSQLIQELWEAIAPPMMRLIGVCIMLTLLSNGTFLESVVPAAVTLQLVDVNMIIQWADKLHLTPLLPFTGFVILIASLQVFDRGFLWLSTVIPIEIRGEAFPRLLSNDDIAYVWKQFPRADISELSYLVGETYELLREKSPSRYKRWWDTEVFRYQRRFKALKSFFVVALLTLALHQWIEVPWQLSWSWLLLACIGFVFLAIVNALGHARALTNCLYEKWYAVIRHFSEEPLVSISMEPEKLASAFERINCLKACIKPIGIELTAVTWLVRSAQSLAR